MRRAARRSPRWGRTTACRLRAAERRLLHRTDFRAIVPRFSEEYRKANQALVDVVTKFAQQKKATPAQIALAWLLAKKPWVVPIPGTTKLSRLEDNLRGATIELTTEDVRALEETSSAIKVEGDRYPATHQKLIDR
jgi:aryl-alcohol dehydrogenase-like predicted oxidoreductase